ncbi:helix-turn-helix domain-containing protein [Pararcticibacter amylolyticus]|uniref:Helix-turn-helix domain-containing protein n=1 Tax=Pararcticibacter amylolyticus TaxID=2173175 RepID=A0A2U2PA65_9SPHI|nr:helix-turn-helix domain-containing protein [Pararcticibacter amylolyticus]PWG78194.1 hypothetical protein DDR33_23605 [Pararcticibacter amylolyticus]
MREFVRLTRNIFNLVSLLRDVLSMMKDIHETQKEMEADIREFTGKWDNEVWLTCKEAAALIRMSEKTIRNWREAGKLSAKQVGGRYLFARSEVLKQLK